MPEPKRQPFPIRALQRAAWVAKNPSMAPQVWWQVRNRLFVRDNATKGRDEALAWCRSLAISGQEAVAQLTGSEAGRPPAEEHPEVFAEANRRRLDHGIYATGSAYTDLVYWIAKTSGARRILETGVANGWSTLAFLLAIRGREGAKLVSVDFPPSSPEIDRAFACVVPDDLRGPWTPIREPDIVGVPKALDLLGEVDLAHYDSDKSYAGRMRTYPLIWDKLAPGALLISDDIDDNIGFHDFCKRVGEPPTIVEQPADDHTLAKFIGVLRKP